MARVRKRVLITGNVQGVSFRFKANEEATKNRVGGWIRNLPDGRVEAAFEGEAGVVDAMLAWCRQGPPGSKVTNVQVQDEPTENDPRFRIVR